jgi:hypothetical protein
MSSTSQTSLHRRLLHSVKCYLLMLSLGNLAGLPIIVLAFMLLPRFPFWLSICHLFLVLSLAAWVDYAWFRKVAWGGCGSRALAYSWLALSAGSLYVCLNIANRAFVAVVALLLGLLVLLAIWRLKLWLRPEDFYPVWR